MLNHATTTVVTRGQNNLAKAASIRWRGSGPPFNTMCLRSPPRTARISTSAAARQTDRQTDTPRYGIIGRTRRHRLHGVCVCACQRSRVVAASRRDAFGGVRQLVHCWSFSAGNRRHADRTVGQSRRLVQCHSTPWPDIPRSNTTSGVWSPTQWWLTTAWPS